MIGLFAFNTFVSNFSIKGEVIIVDYKGGGNYTKIQDAIDSASSSDTIRVRAGQYDEDITISKSITLEGIKNSSSDVTIKGTGTGDVVSITANWVNVSGFTISNSSSNSLASGIKLDGVENCDISKNNLTDNRNGIYLTGSSNNTINENYCFSTTSGFELYGIRLISSDYNSISKNNCSDLDNGIYLTSAFNNTISKNKIYNNKIGIGLSLSDQNSIIDNICTMNAKGSYIHDTKGYYLTSSQDNYLSKNSVTYNEFGFTLYSSNTNELIKNYNANNGNGIYLNTSSNNTLTINNCIRNKRDGIGLFNSSNNSILGNSMSYNGLYISGDTEIQYYQQIDTTNKVDGKLLFYRYRSIDVSVPANIGAVILINCTNNVFNNLKLNNGSSGILLVNSLNSTINYTSCLGNNRDGITIINSPINTLQNINCMDNKRNGIYLANSNNSIIRSINCSNNGLDGIHVRFCMNISVDNNSCFKNNNDGIDLIHYITNRIIANNTCSDNGEAGIRIKNGLGNLIKDNICHINRFGIYILNLDDNLIIDNYCDGNSRGIRLDKSKLNEMYYNIFSQSSYGVHFYLSPDNYIENCSIISNINDLYLRDSGKKNIGINSSIRTALNFDATTEFINKNYLHIQVNDAAGLPIAGADVKVKDNGNVIYATSGYGGSDLQTDAQGQIKWILVWDRVFNRTSTRLNSTEINVKYSNLIIWNLPRIADMRTSHFEYFYPNSPPDKIDLSSPKMNSFLNDTTPTLTWMKGNDTNGDTLSYFVQVDESGGDWSTLVDSTHTNPGVLSWDVFNTLTDDSSYQWRVRGNDTLQNSTWSDTWVFTIDSDQLVANKPQIHGAYNTTGTVRWWWTPTPDTGSGIVGYYVYIGSTANANDVVNGEFVSTTWYELTSLIDGTYYCRVRVENGAGTMSPFSITSDVILVDKEIPNINKPLAWDVYNNTGTVRWSWAPSFDTGSGLVGYYVYISTYQDGNDIVDGGFTNVNGYELSGLLDGVTYFCRIKALNGAGSTSDFSPSSDGVLIDLDIPVANIPVSHGKYNNTRTVIWSWSPAVDTGSGIAGYYVTISRDSTVTSARGPAEDIVHLIRGTKQ
jgi:parallel beta-helix repeat protein